MGKYLTNFKTKEEYEDFKASGEYLTPNVSFIETAGSVINDSYQVQGGSASTMEYFRVESIKEYNLQDFASLLKWHNESADSITIAPVTIFTFRDFESSSLIAVGIDFQSEYRMPEPFNGKLSDVLLKMGFPQAVIDSIPRITKEEFYNLDNGGGVA